MEVWPTVRLQEANKLYFQFITFYDEAKLDRAHCGIQQVYNRWLLFQVTQSGAATIILDCIVTVCTVFGWLCYFILFILPLVSMGALAPVTATPFISLLS